MYADAYDAVDKVNVGRRTVSRFHLLPILNYLNSEPFHGLEKLMVAVSPT